MIKSMTGFGRGENADNKRQFTVEIKTVNHRYNDIVIRMPKKLNYLEENIKKLVKEKINRGRVEIYVSLENVGQSEVNISLNRELAAEYIDVLKTLSKEFQIVDDISATFVSKFPEVVKIEDKEEDQEEIWNCLKVSVMGALEQLVNMRLEEGQKLALDIEKRCYNIDNVVEEIKLRSPKIVEEHREKLRQRIEDMLGDSYEIDDQRLAVEVAYMADKSNITEEIVRLKSHIDQLNNSLKSTGSIGRKLDFLIQEMNREINTIGSKTNDLEVTNYVVDVKSELEKIREQVQNIE
ncbi:YicC/YloC family endoribonuclease [Anaeromicrobium sediminis]|uniref:YicC family protein n=1 Tax=Anaeromicrobium sediminis TaxID=1478221 RepID=A0A267MJ89_9FIRM|nr:YicC/YloC family endoribonuclease [Anaeromicrobium sediminis]PAB58860.1 YicC family protein [Anaeromicrobium sediminis]